VQDGELERGDLYLNLTGDVIAPAGERLPFIVLAKGVEYILWRPRKDNNGGILARAKPVHTPDGVRYQWDKPNTHVRREDRRQDRGELEDQGVHRRRRVGQVGQ
jgi:hypothetical protein